MHTVDFRTDSAFQVFQQSSESLRNDEPAYRDMPRKRLGESPKSRSAEQPSTCVLRDCRQAFNPIHTPSLEAGLLNALRMANERRYCHPRENCNEEMIEVAAHAIAVNSRNFRKITVPPRLFGSHRQIFPNDNFLNLQRTRSIVRRRARRASKP